MTTLAAWIGIDQRAPASIYLVSDSRFSSVVPGSEARPKLLTDEGQKIFACKQEPHLFGYWGWVAFPSAAIARAVAAIDHEDFFASVDDAKMRNDKFSDFIVAELEEHLIDKRARVTPEFAILHAMREHRGMKSKFCLWILGWQAEKGWNIRERKLPDKSEVLYAGGSGAEWFLRRDAQWKDSELGRTSRGVFSAFVEALIAKKDEHSGGAPQLGGLFREGRAMELGVVYNGNRYLRGKPVSRSDIPRGLEWFNELFERTDPLTLKRLPRAQRHAKPSWLAPWPTEKRTKGSFCESRHG